MRYSLQSGRIGARMWLACANAIVASFLVTGGVGLYQPTYQISLFEEGNTELDAADEEMGGAVEMQLDPVEPEVVPPEVVEEIVPPEVVMEEPVPEVVEPVLPENVIFPVPEKEQIIEPIKMVEVKPKLQPKPKPPAPKPRPVAVASTGTGTAGGATGAGQGMRTGGSGSRGKFPAPPYPSWARSKGVAGSVTVAIATDAAGTVTDARVLATSGNSELDSYTCSWIQRRWRFPAGTPMTRRQPVYFRLR
ncbi:MAG TPA: energy transducer TonB [Candidatus Saccharimonadia bacterium]|nr:energy transducer TonB [Candidatus Saccharimonadia bacterium]